MADKSSQCQLHVCAFHLLEICLLTDDRRVASVKATTTVDVFSLSKEQFQEILEEYPEMKQTMSTVAVERLHKIGLNPPRKLSANVSGLLSEQTDDCMMEHESSVFPPTQNEGMEEASEGCPLRRRQVSFASEDELIALRRWSGSPRFSSLLQNEQWTTSHKRKMSLLSTGGKRTAHKLDPAAAHLGCPGGSLERLPLTPAAAAETSPRDPPTTTDTACLSHKPSSPVTAAAARRSTKVHPLPPLQEGKDLG